jgi:hypothetical protein
VGHSRSFDMCPVPGVRMATRKVPVPVPKSGEVLVRVAASPVNPSDYGGWKKDLAEGEEWRPAPCGKEGAYARSPIARTPDRAPARHPLQKSGRIRGGKYKSLWVRRGHVTLHAPHPPTLPPTP